ncbi:MAG: carboxypeptidase-like regulatory domain-containing protein [Sphingobacteriales bacterium]|nr:carboxypeptidase-like regulatory domain-containing protein [Sphingobacteriales bacterium]
MRKIFFYILFSCVSLISYGQYELKGVVIDAKTKEPLPYVNYSISSGSGGTTDDSGRFEFTVNAKTDSVVFSYLGYKDEIVKKRFFIKDSFFVKMHLENFMLEEFTVKAKRNKIPKDTVAIRIFRNVVKHKDENKPKSYDSYQYEEYQKTVASLYNISSKITTRKIFKPFRFILENQDTTAEGTKFIPLILKETLSDYYFNKEPKKNKSVVKASKISGIEQLRFSELLDIAFDEIDAYDNQAIVQEKTFVMPFADGGLALYNYYLIDSVKLADTYKAIDSSKFIYKKKTTYFDKIKYDTIVISKQLSDSIANNGLTNSVNTTDSSQILSSVRIDTMHVTDSIIAIDTIVVRDSVWIYNLAFVPKSKSDLLFNGKATIRDSSFAISKIELTIDKRSNINFINDFSLKQGFENTGKGWFKNEESRSTNVAITKRKKAKSVRIARYLHRKDIQVDQPIADTILRQENTILLKDYRRKSDSFWTVRRHDSLSLQEGKVYFLIDSLKKTRFYKAMSGIGSFFASGYYKTKTLEYGNLYQLVTWNDREGVRLRVNLRNNWRIGKWVNWNVYGAYGIRDKRFKYGAALSINLPDKKDKKHSITLSYKDDYQRFTLNNGGLSYDFIYMSLLRRNAISDLVYLKDARLSYMREWVPNFTTTLNFSYKIYQTIPGRIEFIKTDGLGDTDRISKFSIFSPGINIVYTPGAKFLQGSERVRFLKGKLPRFNFTYVFSAKKLGSDFNFHKMELIMDERLPSPIGHTNIRLVGTKLFGSAPYPLLHIHSGNESFMYNKERFSNMLETEFIADQQLTLMIEHHFDGFFFNKIPGWKKLGLREVFTTKMAVSSLDPKKVSFSDLPADLKGLNGFYAEIGFGIENILKLVRVDFSWRLTQLNEPNIKKFRWTISFSPAF